MRGKIFGLVISLGIVGLMVGCGSKEHEHEVGVEMKMEQPATATQGVEKPETTVGQTVQYTCPMHPEVISNKPGKCPKCGMNLGKK